MKSLATITTILLLTGCGSSTTIVGGPEDLGEAGAIGEAGQAPIDETGGMEQTGGTGGSTGGNLPTGGFATGGSPTGGSITGGSAGTISTGGQETGGTPTTGGTNVVLPAGCQLVSPTDDTYPNSESVDLNDCARGLPADHSWRWQLACCGNANLAPTHDSFAECRDNSAAGPYPEKIENSVFIERAFECKIFPPISESVGIEVYCCMPI